jgi:hypothetical protein
MCPSPFTMADSGQRGARLAALTIALSNPRARGKHPAAGPVALLFGCFFFAAVAGGRWQHGLRAMGSRRLERVRERARRAPATLLSPCFPTKIRASSLIFSHPNGGSQIFAPERGFGTPQNQLSRCIIVRIPWRPLAYSGIRPTRRGAMLAPAERPGPFRRIASSGDME